MDEKFSDGKLTGADIQGAKPRPKPYKLADGKGLYLLVHPNGSRYWRLKYRLAGREKLLALGVFPDVALATARERRDEARRLLAEHVDPMLIVSKRAWTGYRKSGAYG